MIARENKTPMTTPTSVGTKMGRRLRRYKRRWLVERVFAWLMRSLSPRW
jgi:hypothetical protein